MKITNNEEAITWASKFTLKEIMATTEATAKSVVELENALTENNLSDEELESIKSNIFAGYRNLAALSICRMSQNYALVSQLG